MFSPNYIAIQSLVEGKVQIHGGSDLIKEIREFTQKSISRGKNLYTTQEEIETYLKEKHGAEWYHKSAEAVSFIVENEYANDERKTNNIQDKKQFEKDMRAGVLY